MEIEKFRFPGAFEPQTDVFINWLPDYCAGEDGDKGREVLVEVVKNLLGHVNVHVNCGCETSLEACKQMLADAGYTEPVELTLSIRTGSTFYEQIATLIKSEVDQAGFSCNIELLESATLTDKYSSQSHQATILQWVDDYQDPSGVVGWTVDYDQAQCFYTGLNDEELDALYMAAQTEMDHDKRVEMYRDIQQQVYDNANVIPLYRNDFAFARSAKVDGLQVNPFYVYQAMYWTKAN